MTTLIPKFKQTGTGAVNRAINFKLAEIVSVLDFGADSTNVADSTSAIQAAIDTGNSVYVPTGTYKVTGVTISTPGQMIYGDGPDLSKLNIGSTGTAITFNNIRMAGARDLGVIGAGAGTATIGISVGILSSASFCQRIYVENVYLFGLGKGLALYGSNTGSYTSIFSESCGTAFLLQPFGAGDVNGNVMTALGGYDCAYTLDLSNASTPTVTASHNYIDCYSEAYTTTAFKITGYDNQLYLYPDTPSGAGVPFDVGDSNFLFLRDSTNGVTAGMRKNNIVNFSEGGQVYLSASRIKKNDIPLLNFTAGGSIQTSDVTGNMDKAIVRISNTSGAGQAVYLQCMADMPSGFELLIVHPANEAGVNFYVPTTGAWTTLNWTTADYKLAFAAYSTARFIKVNSTSIMFLPS